MSHFIRQRFFGMNKDLEDRLLPEGDYRDALNCKVGYVNEEADGSIQNTLGNFISTAAPSNGTSEVIGSREDESAQRLFYFLHNTAGEHGVYMRDLKNFINSRLITGSFLNFDLNFPITGIGIVGDLLYWTDGKNPQRVINVTRDYSNATENDILMHKIPPNARPEITGNSRQSDASRNRNYIAGESYQFAYRYRYQDEELSVFSPLSISIGGEFDPPSSQSSRHFIQVNVTIQNDLIDSVKTIEIAFVKNNDGIYNIFNNQNPTTGITTYSVNFYGDETTEVVASSESAKITESIPFLSKGLAAIESRVFVTSDESGFPPSEDKVTLQLNQSLTPASTYTAQYKEGALYDVGLVYYDGRMRPTGVRDRGEITTDYFLALNFPTYFDNGSQRPAITCSIAGIPPDFAHYYQVMRTDQRSYEVYAQYPVNVLQYLFDSPETEDGVSESLLFIDGKAFQLPENWSASLSQNAIYLQMPRGVPFIPDKDTFIRVKDFTTGTTAKIERVREVIGDFIVTGDFGIDYTTATPKVWFVEVFKYRSQAENRYYEASEVLPITSPETEDRAFSNTNVALIYGDTWEVSFLGLYLYPYRSLMSDENYTRTGYKTSHGTDYQESPTPIAVGTPQTLEELPTTSDRSVADQSNTIYVMDYQKIADSKGRQFVRITDEDISKNNKLIRYSNTFVAGTRINGLSNFEALNSYQMPLEYSEIVALIPVKNVLLSIHEQHANSLYIKEALLTTPDGSDTLTQSVNVIGDDRELVGFGRFGSTHPLSIVVHEGKCYWFDAIHGAVVEYSNAGVQPISERGMSNFFREKAVQYANERVVCGYDPLYDELMITFRAEGSGSQITLTPETYAYSAKIQRWTTRYSFTPELYGKVGNTFYSFNLGTAWRHHNPNLFNNFYNTKYNRELTWIVNVEPTLTKLFTNIHLNAESIANGSELATIEISTPDGQHTTISKEDFTLKEGVFRSFIYRDDADGNNRIGDPIRSQVMKVEFINDRDDLSTLFDASVVFNISKYTR